MNILGSCVLRYTVMHTNFYVTGMSFYLDLTLCLLLCELRARHGNKSLYSDYNRLVLPWLTNS